MLVQLTFLFSTGGCVFSGLPSRHVLFLQPWSSHCSWAGAPSDQSHRGEQDNTLCYWNLDMNFISNCTVARTWLEKLFPPININNDGLLFEMHLTGQGCMGKFLFVWCGLRCVCVFNIYIVFNMTIYIFYRSFRRSEDGSLLRLEEER